MLLFKCFKYFKLFKIESTISNLPACLHCLLPLDFVQIYSIDLSHSTFLYDLNRDVTIHVFKTKYFGTVRCMFNFRTYRKIKIN